MLVEREVTVWLNEDQLQPGLSRQRLLEIGIKSSRSVAVLVGKDRLGPWEDEEAQAALLLALQDGRPVIPVLLPGSGGAPDLPLFLASRVWLDLRDGFTDEGIARLIWGITGNKPRAAADSP
jgi:TIR domain